MKKLIYFLSIILFTTLLWQGCENDDLPGSICGTVMDKVSGEPIKSAGVELSPGGLKTVTGSEGQFVFTQLTPGYYTLLITKTGYVDFATSTVNVLSNEIANRDVQIEKLPPVLKVVNDSRQEISELDFGSSVDDVARSFSLFNDGEESLEWQIVATADWVKSISKEEGVLSAGATQALIVTIDRKLLKSGKNTTTVHITSNIGSKQLEIIAFTPFDPKEAEIARYKALPTFTHAGETYRAYQVFNATLTHHQAIESCSNLTYGGYSDWVLPEKSVLNTMFLKMKEIGGFVAVHAGDIYSNTKRIVYWSSTKGSGPYAWGQFFWGNSEAIAGEQYAWSTDEHLCVRCIRKE